MKCKFELCMDCDLAKNCACYRAVMQTYKCMAVDETIPEYMAVEAAQRVYAHHRPHEQVDIAHLTVERWISEGRMQ